jgi:cellulose synthase/poly-beta-1,6-N-acetylglucosamine synthase-like glycosyltransferase
MASSILWGAISLILYTYIVYPALLWLAARLWSRPQPAALSDERLPTVSVLIAAYNEEHHMPAKLANCAALDYPPGQIEFLIGSDGSDDATNTIVRAQEGANFHLLAFPLRRGKPATLNDLIAAAKGDILVFTDANTILEPQALRRLAAHFVDPRVGAVAGRLILRHPHQPRAIADESLYWRYESWIKAQEGRLGVLAAAPGALRAQRRTLAQALPTKRLVSDDMLMPGRVLLQGYAVTTDNEAIGREDIAAETRSELRRKIRVGEAGYNTLVYLWPLLLPWRGRVAWMFWSHKVIRWLVPFFLLAVMIANLFLLRTPAYLLIFIGQVVFYCSALLGYWLERRGRLPWFLSYPYYFAGTNLALMLGCIRSLVQAGTVTWARPNR